MKSIYKTLGLALVLTITGCSKLRTMCDHEYESDCLCIERTCIKCGHVSEPLRDHKYEDKHTCHDRTCINCGFVCEATTEHTFESEYPCVDRKCKDCGAVVEGTGHTYECVESEDALIRDGELDITAKAEFHKTCKVCGKTSDDSFVGTTNAIDFAPTIKKSIEDTKRTLKFKEDGSFKILAAGDPQFHNWPISGKTVGLLADLIDAEKPDFVFMPGDMSYNYEDNERDLFIENLTKLVKVLEDNQIPWAHSFGNHDYRNPNQYAFTLEEQMKIYNTFDYCLSRDDGTDLQGCSNYNLPILSSDGKHVSYQLWSLDTNNGGLHYKQEEWYQETSEAMKEENGGVLINSMMFFHIPLTQMNKIYEHKDEPGFIGHAGETPSTSPGNGDMFSTLKEVGDVRLVVNSHDHKNDFIGTYDGIDMCYISSIGYDDYRDESMMGARVINLNEEDLTTYETHMVYANDLTHNLERANKTTSSLEEIDNNKEDILDAETPLTEGQYITSLWDGNRTEEEKPTFEIVSGKGYKGSNGYKLNKVPTIPDKGNYNSVLRLYFNENKTVSSDDYLRLWMNFENSDVRKAAWGVITEDGKVYNTDNFDDANPGLSSFMLFDGDTSWRKNTMNSDGCFGKEGSSYSLKDYKGFMSFSLTEMKDDNGNPLDSGSVTIKGVYLFFDAVKDYRGNPFYFDRIALCNDFSVFEK